MAIDYDTMTLEELEAEAKTRYEALHELADGLTDDLTAVEQLSVQEQMATHRAHLAVINPLRSELAVQAELEQSRMMQKLKRMSPKEWSRLTQAVTPGGAAALPDVPQPGARK